MIDIKYIDHMGSDLRVVDAARISFGARSYWDYRKGDELMSGATLTKGDQDHLEQSGWTKVIRDKDKSLIHFLARGCKSQDWDRYITMLIDEEDRDEIEGIIGTLRQLPLHFTPFTHCAVTMYESIPIFMARQRFKHTVGFSYNEESRRYIRTEPELFTPEVWRKVADDIKQGSHETDYVRFISLNNESVEITSAVAEHYRNSLNLYSAMIESGVAPEQARIVIPQSMMTKYYVTGSLCAWARARNLRAGKDAQREIQSITSSWTNIIKPLYQESWNALTRY